MSKPLNRDSIVRRHRDLLTQVLDDDLLMADLETGHYFGLAKVGRRIWELLEQPASIAQLCEQLQAEYAVEPQACEREVLQFLTELLQDGLIKTVG